MAITFDTTVGGASSNSYITVAEFNDYVEKQFDTDNMPKSSQTTLIQKLLIAGTEAVDFELSKCNGSVTATTQALEFPRSGILDRRGNEIDENTLPQELKDAVAEMAIWLFQNNVNHAQHDDWDKEPVAAELGTSISFEYDNNTKPNTMIPSRVKFLLTRMGNAYVPKRVTLRRG